MIGSQQSRSQTWDRNYTDIRARVEDVAIGQPLQVHLIVHDTSLLFEGGNQGAEVVPTAENHQVIAIQDGLRNVGIDFVKDSNDVGVGDTNGSRYWIPSGAGSVSKNGRTRCSVQQLVDTAEVGVALPNSVLLA